MEILAERQKRHTPKRDFASQSNLFINKDETLMVKL